MHYLFGIICFVLLITSPLPAPDNEQGLESCPRSQSLPRTTQTAARRPQGYFTSPGKTPRLCQKLLTALQTPQATYPLMASIWHSCTLPHVQRELLKPAPVPQGFTCSQKKPAPHSHSSCPEPFLHFEPNLLSWFNFRTR